MITTDQVLKSIHIVSLSMSHGDDREEMLRHSEEIKSLIKEINPENDDERFFVFLLHKTSESIDEQNYGFLIQIWLAIEEAFKTLCR
jgi:hypothetical protein